MQISSGNLLVCLLQISPGNLFIADQFKQSVQYIYQSLAQAICSFAVQLRQRVYCRLAQAMHFLADYPRQSVCIFKADQLRQSVSIFIASQLEHSITSIIAICFYSIFIADKLNILLLHFLFLFGSLAQVIGYYSIFTMFSQGIVLLYLSQIGSGNLLTSFIGFAQGIF